MGEKHPRVDGPLSLDCYKRAAEQCFRGFADDGGDPDEFVTVSYHVPFPKMVKKAATHVGESLGWDQERTATYFAERIDPYMGWNRATGNAYTASLWVSVAEALVGRAEGDRLAAFSYGSGFGAELLTLTAGPRAAEGAWAEDVEKDFAERTTIDAAAYVELRGEKVCLPA